LRLTAYSSSLTVRAIVVLIHRPTVGLFTDIITEERSLSIARNTQKNLPQDLSLREVF